MRLNDNQQEKAIGLRELLTKARPEGAVEWAAYMDFTRALGKMLDGADHIQMPTEIKQVFDQAWKAYIRLWGALNNRILTEALGDEELLNKVKEHRNGKTIVNRILQRIKEQNGGVITSEVDARSTEVTDILSEEMDEWDEV